MLIKRPDTIKPSEITDEADYLNRREFMRQAGKYIGGAYIGAGLLASEVAQAAVDVSQYQKTAFGTDEKLTKFKDASRYNNFYEFSLDKALVREKAQSLVTDPWTLTIEGEAEKTGSFALEDVIPSSALEERIYRFRCVEAWSMVVPWMGVPLATVLKAYKPTSKAKYVRFETLYDPKQMPNQDSGVLEWPYQEALRIDEAMHPLTMLVVGMYGKKLPNQNGAPIRLIVPWKYGFKSIKSIVKISFTEQQPETTWSNMSAREYGFYANVNPLVSHPRWSQAKERRIGASIFAGKSDTRPFNGYGDEVASLYAGMDLQKYF